MTASAQASLFDQPVPYRRFSDTSRAAAASMEPAKARLRRAVLAAYRKAAKVGLTADQCAIEIRESVLATRPRVTELFMAGLLVKTDRTAENASGRRARVLEIREALLSR